MCLPLLQPGNQSSEFRRQNRPDNLHMRSSFGRIFRETSLPSASFAMFLLHPTTKCERDANVRQVYLVIARSTIAIATLAAPLLVCAQTSPFNTGANSLVSFALTIATPVAILVVIGAAIAAAVGRISWGWVVGLIVGIAAIFGSPQIVAWIRGMFGV